jgi:hypothetical protein
MISSTTPDKLADIIRDTWPQLYNYTSLKGNETEISSGISTNTSDILQKRNKSL